jgi:transposase
MNITTIGVDLAKSVFQVHGVDKRGKVMIQKRLRRSKVLAFFVQLPPCLIGMEKPAAVLTTGPGSCVNRAMR